MEVTSKKILSPFDRGGSVVKSAVFSEGTYHIDPQKYPFQISISWFSTTLQNALLAAFCNCFHLVHLL